MTIPMAIVPAVASLEMIDAAGRELVQYPNMKWDDERVKNDERGVLTTYVHAITATYDTMLAASPTSGRVSRADLERACSAMHARISGGVPSWEEISDRGREDYRDALTAALQALGLSLEPGIQDEGGV